MGRSGAPNMRVEFKATTRIAKGIAYGDAYQSMILEIEREGLLGRKADPIKMAGVFRAAQVVRKRMRATIPPVPRTGRLRGAIRARRNPRYRETLITIANAPHWFIIEFGRKPGVTPEGRSYPGAPTLSVHYSVSNENGRRTTGRSSESNA